MRLNNKRLRVHKVHCTNGRSLCRIQSGNGLFGNLLKMGVKSVGKLLKNVNIGKIARNIFSSGKKIAVEAGTQFIKDNKQKVIDQGKKAASDFLQNKSEKLINDLSQSSSLEDAGKRLKSNLNALPKSASQELQQMVANSKGDLVKSAKSNVSKSIKNNTKESNKKRAVQFVDAISPENANMLNNIIEGKGVKTRRKISGRGIKILI